MDFILQYFRDIIETPNLKYQAPFLSDFTYDYQTENFFVITPLLTKELGWLWKEQNKTNPDDTRSVILHQNQVISIQFDFYGKDAFDNANNSVDKINLHQIAKRKELIFGLKEDLIVKDMLELDNNKNIVNRYLFMGNFFVVKELDLNYGTPLEKAVIDNINNYDKLNSIVV